MARILTQKVKDAAPAEFLNTYLAHIERINRAAKRDRDLAIKRAQRQN